MIIQTDTAPNARSTPVKYWVGIWGIVKIMVPFWVPIIIRGLIRGLPNLGDPKRDHNFDNYPYYKTSKSL